MGSSLSHLVNYKIFGLIPPLRTGAARTGARRRVLAVSVEGPACCLSKEEASEIIQSAFIL